MLHERLSLSSLLPFYYSPFFFTFFLSIKKIRERVCEEGQERKRKYVEENFLFLPYCFRYSQTEKERKLHVSWHSYLCLSVCTGCPFLLPLAIFILTHLFLLHEYSFHLLRRESAKNGDEREKEVEENQNL
jgi:hypothetical protein